jgi:pilus assembly protein FimV
MSKKFLTESQVRRFQTLASVPSIREMDEMPPEEEMSDNMPPMGGEEEMSMEPEMEPELEPEMADAPEEGGELDLSPEQKETLAADIVRAVAQELEGALELDAPIEVAVEDDMAPMGDMEMEPPMDAEMDIEPEAALDGMAPEEEVPMGDEEELAEVVDDEAVVNEVLRRVVARLQNNK